MGERSGGMRPGGFRRTAAGVAATLVAATLTVAAASPARADVTVSESFARPASGVFTLAGHGWGHGRGLSQYGAAGAAQIGKTATQIVATYYPSTASVTQANTSIRVKLSSDTRTTVREFIPAAGQVMKDLTAGTTIAVPTSALRWRVRSDSAGLHVDYDTSAGTTQVSGTYRGPIQVTGSFVRVLLKDGTSRDYRTSVRVLRSGTSSLLSLAVMPMESYLYGVVPRESLSSWPAAALQAQAIAARSYSTYKRDHVSSTQVYDICDTTQCQVFMGSAKYTASGTKTGLEPSTTTKAVQATAGIIRTYNGSAIFAEFSASNGGFSTSGDVPYLVAKADPWDGITGSSSHLWAAKLPVSALEARYPSIGSFRKLTITKRDGNGEWGGRVLEVVLSGVDANGQATSYTTTGSGLYNAYTWPAHSDGLRSRWIRIIPPYDAAVVSRSTAPRLVLAPGNPKGTLSVIYKNTGTQSWPVSGLHLALASPAGGADPLAGDSTKPGTYIKNISNPGASSVMPGEQAQFRVALDVSGQQSGTVVTGYRVRIGTASIFGATATWTLKIEDPVFTGVEATPPALVSSTYAPPSGGPAALLPDGRTVIVPKAGTTTLRLSTTNTGNLSWPVGTTSPVQLGTSGPRGRVSDSATSAWISTSRVSRLAAAAAVAPGGKGTFDVPLGGNGKPVGVTTEAFEPLWQGQQWITGDATTLKVVRVDSSVARLAGVDRAPATGFTLVNAPTGRVNLVVQMRNLGGAVWEIGKEGLKASAAVPLAYHWTDARTPPALSLNVTRPGKTGVWPGEVGRWVVPLYATNKAPGTYQFSLRPASPAGGAYGPSVPVKATVVAANFSWQLTGVHSSVDVPSNGTKATAFYVKNTGNVAWPVGASLRSSVLATSSPSRAARWYSATRPGSLTANRTTPGATYVQPGQVATFVIVLAGNGRTPRSTSERFGMSWDGWRGTTLAATLAYRIV